MPNITIEINEIPHGHGLSFKKGVADGVLDNKLHEDTCHGTYSASYIRGRDAGKKIMEEIAKKV